MARLKDGTPIRALIADSDGTLIDTTRLISHGQYEAAVEYLRNVHIYPPSSSLSDAKALHLHASVAGHDGLPGVRVEANASQEPGSISINRASVVGVSEGGHDGVRLVGGESRQLGMVSIPDFEMYDAALRRAVGGRTRETFKATFKLLFGDSLEPDLDALGV